MRRPFTFILLLAACGPEKSSTGDDSSGGASDTSSATASDTSSATGTPTGGVTDAPTTGEPLSCDAFLPPPPEVFKPVEISIISKLDVPVWIGAIGCIGLPAFRILDAGAVDLFGANSDCFPVQCHEFLGSEGCSVGCNDCAPPAARRIAPGTTFTINWSAAVGVPMQMTAACAPGKDCQRECLRPEPVAAGSYSVQLTASRQCTGDCACDGPDPTASCPLWGSIALSEPFEVEVSLSYPDTASIELVLE